ncbi:MAG TPA: hypothetical protein VIH05_09900 [Tepidiformaceae bacterium]
MEIWDIWYPDAASQGLLFARAQLEAAETVIVHAAPANLRVEIRSEAGRRVLVADGLKLEGERFPMTRLRRNGDAMTREDGWPGEGDIGRPVILPGGEVGILKAWWNAEDGSEWRWSVEFYNHV